MKIRKLQWTKMEGDEETKDELFSELILINLVIDNKSMRILEHYEVVHDDEDDEYFIYVMFTNGDTVQLFDKNIFKNENECITMCQKHFEDTIINYNKKWEVKIT